MQLLERVLCFGGKERITIKFILFLVQQKPTLQKTSEIRRKIQAESILLVARKKVISQVGKYAWKVHWVLNNSLFHHSILAFLSSSPFRVLHLFFPPGHTLCSFLPGNPFPFIQLQKCQLRVNSICGFCQISWCWELSIKDMSTKKYPQQTLWEIPQWDKDTHREIVFLHFSYLGHSSISWKMEQ